MTARARVGVAIAIATLAVRAPRVRAYDVVLNAQGEYMDAYLIDGTPTPRRVVFIDPDPPRPDDPTGPPPRVGRHVNGKLCFFPRGFGHDGQFVIADDTYREACVDRHPAQARCAVTDPRSRLWVGRDPDGWAIFKRNGQWTGRHVHTAWDFSEPQPQGNIDPQGCAFDAHGNLWGNDVGNGAADVPDGSIVVFFPGRRFRYDTYCFIDKALSAPSMPVMDAAGNLYVPETGAFQLVRYSPPFPFSAADCDNPEHLVDVPPKKTVFAMRPQTHEFTMAGMAHVPGSDHWYLGSVAAPPVINEIDADGLFVRNIVPVGVPRNPLGLDVGTDGTIYYAELNLDPTTFDTRCGSVSRVRFDAAGDPLPPERLSRDLAFPDGVTVADSRRFRVRFDRLPDAPDFGPARCGGE